MRNILNLLFIVRKSLRSHVFSTTITVVSIALAAGLIMSIFSLKDQAFDAFTGGSGGFDAVLGAKGSELQLVLNSVFHLETSPGNIPWILYEDTKAHPDVEIALPYATGDSYRGYRIVGTTAKIFDKYPHDGGQGFEISGSGKPFDENEKEAVIGSFVSQRTGLKAGSTFRPAHGVHTHEEYHRGHVHEEEFTVTGVIRATNTPADRVIWIPIERFYRMEGHVLRGAGEDYIPQEGVEIPDKHKEVSAVMLKFNHPAAGFRIKQELEQQGADATLAWPIGTIITDLFDKIGWFSSVLTLVAYMVVLISIGSVLASIYNTMYDRRREFAVLRALGADRNSLFKSVVIESAAITALGTLFGYIVYFILTGISAYIIRIQTGVVIDILQFHSALLLVPGIMILLGILAGIVPAVKAYRTDVAENLNPL